MNGYSTNLAIAGVAPARPSDIQPVMHRRHDQLTNELTSSQTENQGVPAITPAAALVLVKYLSPFFGPCRSYPFTVYTTKQNNCIRIHGQLGWLYWLHSIEWVTDWLNASERMCVWGWICVVSCVPKTSHHPHISHHPLTSAPLQTMFECCRITIHPFAEKPSPNIRYEEPTSHYHPNWEDYHLPHTH